MKVIDPKRIQGASSEVVRDINRRIVLNLIRTRHPISRADLARLCGLQRSTISLIVEQLIHESWVIEGPTGRLPRGRRPTFLHLNEERVIMGVDIRPGQTTVALADANGKFSSREVISTPSDPKTAVDELIACIRRILLSCRGKKLEGVGISLPGRFNHVSDRLVFAPNLKWRDFDLRTPIMKATGVDVELENAANACVLATVWFEHNEASRNLVVVTVSEGIGTGILMNGQLVRGMNGMAGEFGHVPLDPKGPSAAAAGAAAGRCSPPTGRRCGLPGIRGGHLGHDVRGSAQPRRQRRRAGRRSSGDYGAIPGPGNADDRSGAGAGAHRGSRRPHAAARRYTGTRFPGIGWKPRQSAIAPASDHRRGPRWWAYAAAGSARSGTNIEP